MSEILELGGFAADIRQVIRQLKEDLKDDWFPDSFGYEDLLKPDVAGSLLIAALERHHGRFVPEPRLVLNIPKQNGGLRYSLEMSLQDRLYYQLLVGSLIPFYDSLLPNQVLSHRYARTNRRAKRYLFKHPVEQWTHFNSYVAQESRTKPIVLATDIQSYYEYINLEQVFDVLETNIERLTASYAEKMKIRWILEELKRCLPEWSYTRNHGLPQNRDASSFLANLAMLPIDEAMIARGYSYYRYMDDIRVAARTVREAQEALQYLILQLRDRSLTINFSKNQILEPGKEGYEEIRGRAMPLLVEIYNMWQSRSLHVIRRSFAPLQRLTEDLINRKATHERTFRFCINKFRNIALCPELGAPKNYFDPMINVCIQQLEEQPFTSDQLVKFLKAAPTSTDQISQVAMLLTDPNRSHYDWQNYLLWGLLVYKGYKTSELLHAAKTRVLQSEACAERSGAILYLGAMGSHEDRIFLSEKFCSFGEHLSQRNALIAVHEVDFSNGIKQNVKDYVLPSLEGTYRRLREGFFGQYFRPLQQVRTIEICDEVSSYD